MMALALNNPRTSIFYETKPNNKETNPGDVNIKEKQEKF